MSRTLSTTTLNALNAQETDEIFLILLEIDHSDLSSPIRVVGNQEDIIYNSNNYIGYAFQINLPEDSIDRIPTMTLVIDNVDRSIVETIRTISSQADVTLTVIRYDSGGSHVAEIELPPFKMKNTSYTAQTVSADLSLESFAIEPFPVGDFLPSTFPGIF